MASALGGADGMSDKISGNNREPFKPGGKGGEHMDQKQHLKALRITGQGVFEGIAVAMGFQVAKGLFDLHALGVTSDDLGSREVGKRQRSGEQPGFALALGDFAREALRAHLP